MNGGLFKNYFKYTLCSIYYGTMDELETGLKSILAKFRNEDPQIAKNRALRKAVKSLDVEKARKLLEDGADPRYIPPSKKEKSYITSLINFWEDEAVDMVRLLLNYELHPACLQCVFSALCIADPFMGSPRYELLDLVINHGLPLNDTITTIDKASTEWHWTPLQMSIAYGCSKIVQTLIEHGAEISGNEPPLHMVLRLLGDPKLLRYLLEQGADPNEHCEKWDWSTPLHKAFYWGVKWECVSALLEYDADINALDRKGNTPLMISKKINTRLTKQLAKLSFQGKIFSEVNLEHLRNSGVMGLLKECLSELAQTKALQLTEELTLYDVMHARVYNANYIDLLKRPRVLEKIYAFLATEVRHYEDDVLQVAKRIVSNRKILQSEKEKLHTNFTNILPDLIIEKIAFFVCVDSFQKYVK